MEDVLDRHSATRPVNVPEGTELWLERERVARRSTNTYPTTFPLLKYSYAPQAELRPSSSETVLQFVGGQWTEPEQGVFLAPSRFVLAADTRRFLSLTYAPNYVYEWPAAETVDVFRRPGYQLSDVFGTRSRFNRVWPAFGQTGGGLEIVLTSGGLHAPAPSHMDSAPSGDWRMDGTASRELVEYLNDIEEAIREAVGDWYPGARSDISGMGEHEEDEVGGAGKRTPGTVALTFLLSSEWRITISAAYRNPGGPVEVGLWVALWRDVLGCRELLWDGPDSPAFTAECTLEDLRGGGGRDEVKGKLAELLDELPRSYRDLRQRTKWFSLPEPFLDHELPLCHQEALEGEEGTDTRWVLDDPLSE